MEDVPSSNHIARHILVPDDDVDLRAPLAATIHPRGHRVQDDVHGRSALEFVPGTRVTRRPLRAWARDHVGVGALLRVLAA